MSGRTFLLEPIRNQRSFCAHDVRKFGPTTELFPFAVQGRANMLDPEFREHDLPTALRAHRFDPEHDYIVLAGNMAMAAMAVAYLAAIYGSVRVLIWDARDREYVAAEIGDIQETRNAN